MNEGYDKCVLCRDAKPIKNSHVIPKFVFRWMITTGGTKFLRHAAAPNKRVQDGIKYPLLCKNCETDASVWENYFSQSIFTPSVTKGQVPVKVGKECYRFCCVVHLRVISYVLKEGRGDYTLTQTEGLKSACDLLASYLSGARHSASPLRVFLYPLGLGKMDSSAGLPANWNRFVRRHTEYDIIATESESFFASYFKLGPWLCFLHLSNDQSPWSGGEVVNRSTRLNAKRAFIPPMILDYLIERAERSRRIMQSLSPKQREKIEKAVLDGDLLHAGRPMLEALMADYDDFGPSAFE